MTSQVNVLFLEIGCSFSKRCCIMCINLALRQVLLEPCKGGRPLTLVNKTLVVWYVTLLFDVASALRGRRTLRSEAVPALLDGLLFLEETQYVRAIRIESLATETGS